MKRRTWTLGVAAAAAAAGAASWWWRRDVPAHEALWTLRFQQPDGGELVMSTLRGRALVLNFWATWCAPCVREMPALDRFAREFADRGWSVVGLAIDQPAAVREFLGRIPVGFPIGIAGLDGTTLARDLGNERGALPYTLLLDASGRPLRRKLGETSYDELQRWAGEG